MILAAAALLAVGEPYRLVIVAQQGSPAMVDYPSRARCERAKAAIEAEQQRKADKLAQEVRAMGGRLIGSPTGDRVYCIPR